MLLHEGIRVLQRLEILLEPALLPAPSDGVGDADFGGVRKVHSQFTRLRDELGSQTDIRLQPSRLNTAGTRSGSSTFAAFHCAAVLHSDQPSASVRPQLMARRVVGCSTSSAVSSITALR